MKYFVLPLILQLFGPVQWDGALKISQGTEWQNPGSAFTASTKTLWLPKDETPRVRWARWIYVWTPNSCSAEARLVGYDSRAIHPPPVELAKISACVAYAADGPIFSSATEERLKNPDVSGVDITKQLNDLIDTAKSIYIGFQVRDDGKTPWALYESRVEIFFEVAK